MVKDERTLGDPPQEVWRRAEQGEDDEVEDGDPVDDELFLVAVLARRSQVMFKRRNDI